MECHEVYLDNSATTRPYDEVLSFMNRIASETYGNPSSLHHKGIEAERLIKSARKTIADTLSVDSGRIYFTSGGTEANNLAIMGYLNANRRKGKHLITTKTEHPSVIEVFNHLENTDYHIDYLDVNYNGYPDLAMLEELVNSDTSLVSIIYVNNETGVIQPIEEISSIIGRKNPDTVLHVDAVQAYGKMEINPEKSKIDVLTASSHKIHGPKGVGAIYHGEKVRLCPIMYGGGQEKGIRSGTENVHGICGFGKAAEITFMRMDETTRKVKELKNLFQEGISRIYNNSVIISPPESSPYILNVSFPGIKAEILLHHLEQHGIYVSTGAACHSRNSAGSYVLKAMGIKNGVIAGALRISLSSFNSREQVEYTLKTLASVISSIRG